jgi:hypothetical protein
MVKGDGRQFRLLGHYTCSAAQKRGWRTSPSKSVPAQALERYVLAQIAPHDQELAEPSLTPSQQAQRLRQVVTRIDYDGTTGQVTITLRPRLLLNQEAS